MRPSSAHIDRAAHEKREGRGSWRERLLFERGEKLRGPMGEGWGRLDDLAEELPVYASQLGPG
jgi:hypothetical protein